MTGSVPPPGSPDWNPSLLPEVAGATDAAAPIDPDPGLPADLPTSTSDLDPLHVPADVLYQLAEAKRYVEEQTVAIERELAGWVGGVAAVTDAGVGGFRSEINGIVGSVFTRTDAVLDPVVKSLNRLLDGVVGGSDRSSADLRTSGVVVPYDPTVWQVLLDTDPTEWLPHLVPEIGAALGTDPRGPSTLDGPQLPVDGGTGDTGGGYGAGCGIDAFGNLLECAKPPLPPPPPPIGGGGSGELPPPPPFPTDCPPCDPISPYPPPPIGPVCPPPVINIPPCPPVDIKTIVQEIVNAGGGGGSPAKCPDPPPVDVNVNVALSAGDGRDGVGTPPPVGVNSDPGKTLSDGTWTTLAPCFNLPKFIESLNGTNPGDGQKPWIVAAAGKSGFIDLAQGLTRFISKPIETVIDGMEKLIAGVLLAPTQALADGWDVAYRLFDLLTPGSVPNPGAARYWGGHLAQATWAEKTTGFPMTYLFQSEQYAFQFANPQYLPNQTAIDALWQFNRINDDTWECWTKAQGNIPRWAAMVRDLGTQHLTADQLVQLYLRRVITFDEFIERAKLIGWTGIQTPAELLTLAIQIPTQTDLLRMMVRDAADETVVKKYGYDSQLDEKFTGKLREWSVAQGIPKEVFQYFWRAHWVIPSNTQLYEMLHRLRPDRDEVQIWDNLARNRGEDVAKKELGPRPEVLPIEEVRTALTVNDASPFFVEKLIATSYRPITRTDAIRAHQIGSFSDKQLKEAMLDNGYNVANSDLLVKFYKQANARTNANATGVLTIRNVVVLFQEGALNRADADDSLKPLMESEQQRKELLDRAEVQQKAKIRSIQLKGVKRQFMIGHTQPGGWLQSIDDIVHDMNRSQMILDQWTAELSGKTKEVSALMLCKWYNHGLIDNQTYLTRLYNLGFTAEDAARIAGVCDSDAKKKLLADAEKMAKERARLAAKAIADQKKRQQENCKPKMQCDAKGNPLPNPIA